MAFPYKRRTQAQMDAYFKAHRYFDNDDDPAPAPDAPIANNEEAGPLEPARLEELKKNVSEPQASNLLTLLLGSEQYAKPLAQLIGATSADIFTIKHQRRFAAWALDHIRQYEVPPGDHMMRQYIEEAHLDEAEKRFCLLQLGDHKDALAATEKYGGEALLAGFERLYEVARFATQVDHMSGALEQGDLEGAQAIQRDNVRRQMQREAVSIVLGSEEEPIRAREFLLGQSFCRRMLSSVIAPSTIGKTSLRIAQAVALACGRDITGDRVHAAHAGVLFVALEDDLDELRARVRACRLHYGIPARDLKKLILYTPLGEDRHFALGHRGSVRAGPLEIKLRALLAQHPIDLIIIDPFIKTLGGDIEENSNTQINAVADLLTDFAKEFDLAIDLPHHDGKGTHKAGDGNRGRGASAFTAAIRLGFTLTAMTEEEAEPLQYSKEERKRLIRYDMASVNIVPSSEAKWFELVGVELPDGPKVQTLINWEMPEITSGGLAAEIANIILDEIQEGLPNGQRYSDAPRAVGRSAWEVVQRHCPDKSEKACRKIVKQWLGNKEEKTGLLYLQQHHDPVTRKDNAWGLYVNDAKRPT